MERTVAARQAVPFIVRFFVPDRPCAAAVAGRARIYPDSKARSREAAIRLAAAMEMQGREPYPGPVRLILNIWYPMPACWSEQKQAQARAGAVLPAGAPLHLYLEMAEALNGVVWRHHSQIVTATISKRYGVDSRLDFQVVGVDESRPFGTGHAEAA